MAYGLSPRGGLRWLFLVFGVFFALGISVVSDLSWLVWLAPCDDGVCIRLNCVGVTVWLLLCVVLGLQLVGLLARSSCVGCVSSVSFTLKLVLWVWVIIAWFGGVRLSSWTYFCPVMLRSISFNMWSWVACIFLISWISWSWDDIWVCCAVMVSVMNFRVLFISLFSTWRDLTSYIDVSWRFLSSCCSCKRVLSGAWLGFNTSGGFACSWFHPST